MINTLFYFYQICFSQILMDSESDDSSDDEMPIYFLAASLKNNPQRISKFRENIVARYNDVEFQQNFRLNRDVFHFVLTKVLEVSDAHVEPQTIEKKILTIWLLATPECFR